MNDTSGFDVFAGVIIEWATRAMGQMMTEFWLRIGAVFGYLFDGGGF